MDQEVKQIDGHYQLPLPLKNLKLELPNNRMMVERRINQLERRFRRDDSYFLHYKTFMNDMLAKGYAKKSTSPGPLGKSWYIPHHELSDFHKLVITVLKTTFSKNKPCEIVYKNYKYFNSQNFNDELKFAFSKENIDSCNIFNQTFLNVLNKHIPLKKKQFRANHDSYVSKSMRKATMRRSYLENVYLKKREGKSLRAYKKQKNCCSRVYKKERKQFFNKLNPFFVNDNKLFWKTIKPFFSNKGSSGSNIKLVEKDEILQNDKKIPEELNTLIENAVSAMILTKLLLS